MTPREVLAAAADEIERDQTVLVYPLRTMGTTKRGKRYPLVEPVVELSREPRTAVILEAGPVHCLVRVTSGRRAGRAAQCRTIALRPAPVEVVAALRKAAEQ